MEQTRNPSSARKGWFALSRCKGIFRYHLRVLGKYGSWSLLLMLGSNFLALLLPAIFPARNLDMGGISANVPLTMVLSLVCGYITAHRGTRFLLRFGTPRFSVWFCNLLSLAAAMLMVHLGSLLISILFGYLTLGLSRGSALFTLTGYTAQGFLEGAELLSVSLSEALQSLPTQLLTLLEWVCLYYFFGCCLRWKKWLTLAVVIGVPLAFATLTVIPAVRQAIGVAVSGRQRELVMAGMQWMLWLTDALRYLRNEWPTVQLIAAIGSLPLSYLCMRGTRQP